jgi:hypothetical protein
MFFEIRILSRPDSGGLRYRGTVTSWRSGGYVSVVWRHPTAMTTVLAHRHRHQIDFVAIQRNRDVLCSMISQILPRVVALVGFRRSIPVRGGGILERSGL